MSKCLLPQKIFFICSSFSLKQGNLQLGTYNGRLMINRNDDLNNFAPKKKHALYIFFLLNTFKINSSL